jgi:hypothetical protein
LVSEARSATFLEKLLEEDVAALAIGLDLRIVADPDDRVA